MDEIWKDIEGFEGLYQVSNKGRIKSLPRISRNGYGEFMTKEKILKPSICKDREYYIIGIYKNKKCTHFLMHRLIAKYFIPNPNNYPLVLHKDDNGLNNSLDNIYWGTYSMNYADRVTNGGGNGGLKHYNSSLNDPNDVLDIFNAYNLGCFTQKEIAEAYGIQRKTVSNITLKQAYKGVLDF